MRDFWRVLGGAAIATVVASLAGCMTESEAKHYNIGNWCWAINDGKGSRGPLFSRKDYFTLLCEALGDPDEDVRSTVCLNLGTHTHITGETYMFVLDAYVDAGRSGQLLEHLRTALAKEHKNTYGRYRIGRALLELKMRQYLWRHPELAGPLDIDQQELPLRGWSTFWRKEHYPFFAKRLVAEGDKEFAAVWQEYLAIRRALAKDPNLLSRDRPRPAVESHPR